MSNLLKLIVFKSIIITLLYLTSIEGHRKGFSLKEWHQFKLNFNKTYHKQSSENYHRSIFFGNLGRILNHNKRADKGLETYRLGVNRYSDMEFNDFSRELLRYKPVKKDKSLVEGRLYHYKPPRINETSETLTSVDWRNKGIVSDVRDQGTCGSCWAFATVAAMESSIALAKGQSTVTQLSEQNLIDCSYDQGNEGCLGGTNEGAYQYVLEAHGLDTRKSYPYEEKQGQCRFDVNSIGGQIKSFVEIFPDHEDDLLDAASKHVISVALQATAYFQLYSGGIFDDPLCDNKATSLNHAVALIGYGSSDGQDYWLIKNSWGKDWGENGYGRIARGKNLCGIASQASYPLA